MPICGYLLVPARGAVDALAARLAALPGCDVSRALNREVLALVTDTPSADADQALRRQIESLPGVEALLLTFGEVDADAPAQTSACS